jgi:hypothetical protein
VGYGVQGAYMTSAGLAITKWYDVLQIHSRVIPSHSMTRRTTLALIVSDLYFGFDISSTLGIDIYKQIGSTPLRLGLNDYNCDSDEELLLKNFQPRYKKWTELLILFSDYKNSDITFVGNFSSLMEKFSTFQNFQQTCVGGTLNLRREPIEISKKLINIVSNQTSADVVSDEVMQLVFKLMDFQFQTMVESYREIST